jgi:uncharacterized protein YjiS (DUF1127 family)
MNVVSRTLRTDVPAVARLFALLHRAMTRMVATIALWHRRAHERRQLRLMLSTSSPGWLHDTSISCTEAEAEASKPFWRA